MCHTCECTLIGGAIDFLPEPHESPAEGRALICRVPPRGDIEIDL
jgi:ferredoxin